MVTVGLVLPEPLRGRAGKQTEVTSRSRQDSCGLGQVSCSEPLFSYLCSGGVTFEGHCGV